jgi:uncharacterized membrane protein (UPF0127 family)
MLIINARSGETIATHVEIASTRAERRRGLLGRDGLPPGAALLLSPCWAIHTAFMRFAIDAVFVDRRGRAVRIVRDLPPWRLAASPRAHAVVEFAAGTLAPLDLRTGDELSLVPEVPQQALAG